LRERGLDAQVLGFDSLASRSARERISSGIVVVQKLFPNLTEGSNSGPAVYRDLAEAMRGSRATLIMDLNDDHFEDLRFRDLYRFLLPSVKGWIASTEQLAGRLLDVLGVPAAVIPDPYEGPMRRPRAPGARLTLRLARALDRVLKAPAPSARLSVLWFGSPTNLGALMGAVDELLQAAAEMPIDLNCVTTMNSQTAALTQALTRKDSPRLRARLTPWSPDSLRVALAECDVVVIPAELHRAKMLAKTANRLLETLAAGRLAVCHPVPSYSEFQQHAWIGEGLGEGIRWACRQPEQALSRIRTGQKYMAKRYSCAAIAEVWRTTLQHF
jgi:hypothetical protein